MKNKKEDCLESNPCEGRYANYFEVGHNAVEFIVDFGQLYEESKDAKIHTRIVTSPMYAKALMEVLEESLSQFDEHVELSDMESTQQPPTKSFVNKNRPRTAKCVTLRPRKSHLE